MKNTELSQIEIWIMASRPKTLWAAIAPVIIGTAIAFQAGKGEWFPAIATLLAAVLIQIGTNFANDYFDFTKGIDTHERLGPTRVTQAGLVSPASMSTATGVVFSMAFFIGLYLVSRGGWPIAIIGSLSILFGVLYTAGPYPIGYYGFGDIFVLIFFGPVATAGTYYVQAGEFSLTSAVAGIAPGLFSVAILTVNNLRDIDSDRRAGKKTLQSRFGKTFAKVEYLVCVVVACLMPPVLFATSEMRPRSLFATLILLLAVPTIIKVFTVEGKELNKALASTGRLLLFYSLLFSFGWLV
jgi:1,4-dihydroxy-2-naphthoate octaprenyltransferase